MSRLFKALSLALTVLTLSIVSILIASCGSSGTQYRVFNAMSNPNATFNFDVTINGAIITPVGGMGFGFIQPSKGYSGISSGSNTVDVYQAGQAGTAGATPLVHSTVSMSGSNQYTIVLMGNTPTGTQTAWAAQAFPDNNTLPSSGNVEFRVINAAPSLPGAVNVFIVPTASISGATPTFTGVAYGQPSQQPTEYATLPVPTSPPVYYVFVTTAQGTPLFFQSYPFTFGIYTIVLTDVQNGFTFSTSPTVLTDIQ